MNIGEKITLPIGPGIRFPGIIVSEPTHTTVEVPSRNQPGTMKRFPTQFATVITLRTTNPANGPVETFYRQSLENLNFAVPRAGNVDGLDADLATGEKISLETLFEKVLDGLDARQLARAEAGTMTLDELAGA